MHVLHLPPRHLWRITAVAALLAVALTGIIVLALGQISSNDHSSTGSATGGSAAPAMISSTQHVRVPLAPPTVFNQPFRSPMSYLTAIPAASR